MSHETRRRFWPGLALVGLALAAPGVAPLAARTARTPLPPPRPAEWAAPPPAPVIAPPALPKVDALPRIDLLPSVGPTAPAGGASSGECLRALAAIPGNRIRAADAKLAAPADPACAIVEPVTVAALSLRRSEGASEIAFDPPVTVSCAMATTVAHWLEISVQPLARGHFGKEIARLRVGGGHECRRRNRAASGPLSEHATGKALDIFAFVAAGDKAASFTISVEKPDGPAQGRFLEAVRHSACGVFSTVIGPGGDAAHANHLHLDIQPRRTASTRFCQ